MLVSRLFDRGDINIATIKITIAYMKFFYAIVIFLGISPYQNTATRFLLGRNQSKILL